jgi:serine/threonine protein phosphatase 1
VFSYSQQVTREQLAGRYDDDVRWLAGLPYHWERPDIRVVHWGLYPGVPLGEVPEDVRAGTTSGDARLRERFGERPWYDFYEDDVPVAFGHAVVGPEPLILRDRIYGLDTGACHGMRLTGLLLPSFKIVSVPARADHWAHVRVAWQAPVLRTLPWSTMTFEQIDKKLRSLRDPELGDAVLDQIGAWSRSLRDAIPACASASTPRSPASTTRPDPSSAASPPPTRPPRGCSAAASASCRRSTSAVVLHSS